MHQLIITRRPKWLWLMIIKIKKGKKRRRLWLMIRKFFFKKIMIRKLRRIKFWRGSVNINSFPLYFLRRIVIFFKKKKKNNRYHAEENNKKQHVSDWPFANCKEKTMRCGARCSPCIIEAKVKVDVTRIHIFCIIFCVLFYILPIIIYYRQKCKTDPLTFTFFHFSLLTFSFVNSVL